MKFFLSILHNSIARINKITDDLYINELLNTVETDY